jgi:hypothetical protein
MRVRSMSFDAPVANGANKVLGANHPRTLSYENLWQKSQKTSSPPQP